MKSPITKRQECELKEDYIRRAIHNWIGAWGNIGASIITICTFGFVLPSWDIYWALKLAERQLKKTNDNIHQQKD